MESAHTFKVSEVVFNKCRDDAWALGVLVAGCEGADSSVVPPRAGRCVCMEFLGWVAWERTAQDGLDARGSGRGYRPVASAGDPGPRPVGRGSVARHGARLCAGNLG